MPVSALINSFNAGELSPLMDARSDVEKYRNGCITLENFIITPYGGVMRRPGTEFLGESKFNDRRCRLIGFNFSTTTRFVIEMGHLYFRFWSNGVPVLSSGGSVLELSSPYPEEILREVQFVQINDIMYLVHPGFAPRKLSRLADNNWTLAEVDWTWPATLEENIEPTTLALSHVSGNSRTMTASTGIFEPSHVGSYWLIGHNTESANVEQDINGNVASAPLTILGDWELSTSGVWTAQINVEQSDDDGATYSAIRTIKGSADRNVVINGKTERESLLRIRISDYPTASNWSANATFAVDDRVIYENNMYKCVLDHTNTAPAWVSFNVAYAVGDLVTHNTKTYKCLKAHNSNVIPYVRDVLTFQNTQFRHGPTDTIYRCSVADYKTVINWPGGTVSIGSNQIYKVGVGFWRSIAGASGTFDTLRNNNNLQLLAARPSLDSTLTANDILADFEMSNVEKMNYRPTNFEFWEPIDFTPFNAKYWTPINFETRVARLEKLDARQFGIVRVTGFTSATAVTVDVIRTLTSTTATNVWSEGAWSGKRGYPRAVALHEGRIWYGGTTSRPLSIWGSTVEDYENFRMNSDADGSLFLTLSSKEANSINWLDSQDKLMIGTTGNEWTLGSGNSDEGIRPDNVVAKKQSSYGSKYLPVMSLNDVMLFVQRQGRKVRELVYVLDRDGWVAPDLTVLSEHVTAGEIVEADYQQQADAIYWAIRGDGQLIGMTYERDQNVVGWHRHTTDGLFESVATIYGVGGSDEVWLSVQRTVGGQPRRFIERFYISAREEFEAQNKSNWWYLDCAVRKNGSPGTTVSGLAHLNGRTVDLLEDGAVGNPAVVAGGQITLDKPRTTVLAGLPFTSTLQPMTIDIANLPDGTSRGRRKKLHRMQVSVQKSLGGEVSTNGTQWDFLYPRDFNDPMDDSPAPFTGEKEVVTASDYDPNLPIYIRQNQPYPLTVLALVAKLDIYGD